jgi:signal peptidase II
VSDEAPGASAAEAAASAEVAEATEHLSDAPARSWWRGRVSRLSLTVAVVWVVVDQLTKHWAVNALADGEERHVIWTLQWNLAYNSGMAFSKGQGWGPLIGLVAFAVVVVLALSSARLGSRLAEFAAGLLLGGALGNLIDRMFREDAWLRGRVVDFIDFQWFPIFNVADMGVTIGAALFVLSAFLAPTPTSTPK